MGVPDSVIYLGHEEFEGKVREVATSNLEVVRELVFMAPEQVVRDKGTRFFKYKGVVYAETV